MADAYRIQVKLGVLIDHLADADNEPWTPERVAEFLREVGMIHVARNQWPAEDPSPGALHSSEYTVIAQHA